MFAYRVSESSERSGAWLLGARRWTGGLPTPRGNHGFSRVSCKAVFNRQERPRSQPPESLQERPKLRAPQEPPKSRQQRPTRAQEQLRSAQKRIVAHKSAPPGAQEKRGTQEPPRAPPRRGLGLGAWSEEQALAALAAHGAWRRAIDGDLAGLLALVAALFKGKLSLGRRQNPAFFW